MTKEEGEMKIKAAAYAVAAEIGWREAMEMLARVRDEIEGMQWRGPGGR